MEVAIYTNLIKQILTDYKLDQSTDYKKHIQEITKKVNIDIPEKYNFKKLINAIEEAYINWGKYIAFEKESHKIQTQIDELTNLFESLFNPFKKNKIRKEIEKLSTYIKKLEQEEGLDEDLPHLDATENLLKYFSLLFGVTDESIIDSEFYTEILKVYSDNYKK